MIKAFLAGVTFLFLGSTVMAQEFDLFPELQKQFEPVQAKKTTEEIVSDSVRGQDSIQAPRRNSETASAGERQEGNLKIELQNLNGVLPYARNMAYCYGEAVLTNETNQALDSLSVTLTYKDMPADLSYGGVKPHQKQSQQIMLIGPACEIILGMPEIDIKACKLGEQPENACKKRVQFIPPSE